MGDYIGKDGNTDILIDMRNSYMHLKILSFMLQILQMAQKSTYNYKYHNKGPKNTLKFRKIHKLLLHRNIHLTLTLKSLCMNKLKGDDK